MNKRTSQAGFGIVEILLMIVLLAIVGFVGWRVYEANREINERQADTSTVQTTDVPAVTNSSDLDSVESTLEKTDVEGNTSKELDSELNF